MRDGGPRHTLSRLGREDGSAVVEFPLVAALIIAIALACIQAAMIVHVRNSLTDAAVQGAHHASLVGNDPDDGADRAAQLIRQRFGSSYTVTCSAREDEQGRITVEVTAAIPLVGLLGPSGTLLVDGHALDEEQT